MKNVHSTLAKHVCVALLMIGDAYIIVNCWYLSLGQCYRLYCVALSKYHKTVHIYMYIYGCELYLG